MRIRLSRRQHLRLMMLLLMRYISNFPVTAAAAASAFAQRVPFRFRGAVQRVRNRDGGNKSEADDEREEEAERKESKG